MNIIFKEREIWEMPAERVPAWTDTRDIGIWQKSWIRLIESCFGINGR